MILVTAGYEIEDPSDLRFCCAALRGSTGNVSGGNLDTSVGGVLTSVLDGILCFFPCSFHDNRHYQRSTKFERQ